MGPVPPAAAGPRFGSQLGRGSPGRRQNFGAAAPGERRGGGANLGAIHTEDTSGPHRHGAEVPPCAGMGGGIAGPAPKVGRAATGTAPAFCRARQKRAGMGYPRAHGQPFASAA